MSLATTLMAVGIPAEQANRLGYEDRVPLDGNGTTQGSATELMATQTNVALGTSVGDTAFRLPAEAEYFQEYFLLNTTAETALIFPPVGDTIDANAVNTAVEIETDLARVFMRVEEGRWVSMPSGEGGGGIASIIAGDGISVDNTDPDNPVVSNDGVISLSGGAGISVDVTDPQAPIVINTGVVSVTAGSNVSITGTAQNPIINASGGGGGGTVETVAVASANGFAGTSDGDPTNPVLTLSTTVTGLLEGNGAAATAAAQTGTGAVVRAAAGNVSATEATATGSTTARSIADRLADAVNVKDYGAVGDGATDDTAAIQAALDAAIGSVVIVPAGTFIISDELFIPSNVTIDGAGTLKLIDNCPSLPTALLHANGKTGFRIRNITIDANRDNNVDQGTPDANGNQPANWQGTLLAAVNIAASDDIEITNVTIRNCWGSGMWLTDCFDVLVDGNTVEDCRITGIAVRNDTGSADPCERVQVTNNICRGGIVGIHFIFGAHDSVCIGNVCENNKDQNRFLPAYYDGVYPNVYPNSGGFVNSSNPNYVSPALVGDGAGIEATGVFTDPTGTANINLSIVGNTCNQNAVGVRLEETTNQCAVSGNTCRANDFHGILLLSAYLNTITGNMCSGNGLDGIRLEKVTGKQQSGNNVITGNTSIANDRFGVVVLGSQGNTIQGNNLSGNGIDTGLTESGPIGLYLTDSVAISVTLIEGNQLLNYYGTDKYGIYSNSLLNIGNRVVGNAFSASYGTSVTNLAPTTNRIVDNLGAYIGLSDNLQIARNGSFAVAERAMPTTDNSYCLDGWRLLLEAANAATVAQDAADVPIGAGYAAVLTVGSGNNNKFGLWSPIENKNMLRLRGSVCSLRVPLKATAGLTNGTGKIRIGIAQFTGTADAVSGDPVSSWGAEGTNPTLATNWSFANTPAAISVTTSWADYVVENVSISGSATNIAIFVWSDDKTNTQTTDILRIGGYVTLARGAVAPDPIVLPIEIERERCKRYYSLLMIGSGPYLCMSQAYSTTAVFAAFFFPEMRVAPTLEVSSAAHFQLFAANGAGIALSTLSIQGATTKSLRWDATVVAGLVGGNAAMIEAVNASARLALNADL